MLNIDVKQRFTIHQIIQHEWLRPGVEEINYELQLKAKFCKN
jgi:hypothetical protein